MFSLVSIFELIGTVAFAVSGAATGMKKNMDIFGVSILGLVTAVGGGFIRDLTLGLHPPQVFRNPVYAITALATSLLLFIPLVRKFILFDPHIRDRITPVMDAAGLSVFTVMGIQTAYLNCEEPTIALLLFVGVITGVGGGVLRDVLAGDPPYIFVRHIYACASLAGAIACVALWKPLGSTLSMLIGAVIIFAIRCLAAHFQWSLPRAKDFKPH